jgi:hypothetical protein
MAAGDFFITLYTDASFIGEIWRVDCIKCGKALKRGGVKWPIKKTKK